MADPPLKALRVIQARREATSARVEAQVGVALAVGGPRVPPPSAQVLAARAAYRALDEEALRAPSPSQDPACSAGCAFCCHVHVYATSPEILAIAAHLQASLPAGDLAALRDRLERHGAAALTDEERWAARVPCALLGDGGRCSVYPVRPLRCRAFHSRSADACRAAHEGRSEDPAPTIPAIDRLHDAVEEGYDRAISAAGIPPAAERLEAGLLRCLRALAGP